MTIITAARKDDKFAMASDTMHNAGYTKVMTKEQNAKIIEVQGSLIGFAGNVVHRQAVTQAFREIDINLSCASRVYKTMMVLHKHLKANYHLTQQATLDEPFEESGISMLICSKWGIFRVASDYSVLHHNDFWAIGSGMHYALGAMSVIDPRIGSLRHITEVGVKAAKDFCDSCGGDTDSRVSEFVTNA